MAKQFGYTASILKGSNRLIASSHADWSSLKKGSFIIFDEDDNFYKVINKEKFFYIKDFSVIQSNIVCIKGNTDINLSLNDQISLTFKEYEATALSITNGGSGGYAKGDVVEIHDGNYKTSPYDGFPCMTKVSIDKIGANGEVTEASISSPGVYYTAPEETITTDGGLVLNLTYGVTEKRTIEERNISQIGFDGKNTIIQLNSNLPPKLNAGKLSVDKWEVTLNINYMEKNKINSLYRVLVDFTPNLNMPLMRGDLKQNTSIYNEAIVEIDNQIKKIWDELGSRTGRGE